MVVDARAVSSATRPHQAAKRRGMGVFDRCEYVPEYRTLDSQDGLLVEGRLLL